MLPINHGEINISKKISQKDILYPLYFRIGCGLDRLDWKKVSTMLEEVFEDTNIHITVYTL